MDHYSYLTSLVSVGTFFNSLANLPCVLYKKLNTEKEYKKTDNGNYYFVEIYFLSYMFENLHNKHKWYLNMVKKFIYCILLPNLDLELGAKQNSLGSEALLS